MLGLRFTFNQPHQQSWWTDGTVDWLWPAAERAGLPIGLLAAGHFDVVAKVAERHPGLHLLIDHMGRSGGTKDDAAFANLPELLELARHPNVAVKLSGAPSYSSAAYPWRNIHGHIEQIFDAFGPHRSFWGTDITRMPCSYRAMRDDVHRGTAVPLRRRQGIGDGPRAVPMDRLEPAAPFTGNQSRQLGSRRSRRRSIAGHSSWPG